MHGQPITKIYTVYLYPETTLHVSGGTFTHHQERILLYLQHLVFVTPLLLPAARAGSSKLYKVASCWIYWNIWTEVYCPYWSCGPQGR
jgi:hypothetical protein